MATLITLGPYPASISNATGAIKTGSGFFICPCLTVQGTGTYRAVRPRLTAQGTGTYCASLPHPPSNLLSLLQEGGAAATGLEGVEQPLVSLGHRRG